MAAIKRPVITVEWIYWFEVSILRRTNNNKPKGIELKYKNHFFQFYWMPYCPGGIHSKRFEFLHFKIGNYLMTDINTHDLALAMEEMAKAELYHEEADRAKQTGNPQAVQTANDNGDNSKEIKPPM